MSVHRFKVKLVLFERDYFKRHKRVFNRVDLIQTSQIKYLPLSTVMEILEYDMYRKTAESFILTDGSEFVTIPRTSSFAKREGVVYRIDRVIHDQGADFISFRTINRLFNSDVSIHFMKKQVTIHQPGKLFITMKGDTLHTLSELLNASVKNIQSVNPNLKNPIPPGTKVSIPIRKFEDAPAKKQTSMKKAKVNQHIDIAPSIIALGRRLRGTPYRFGAAPYPRSRRFDCSSFLQYIFARNGVRLPRNSRAQARVGKFVDLRRIEPGDLLFFRRDRYSDNRIGHCGMDIGNGRMLNTYQSPPGVTISRWRKPFWMKRYMTSREIL